MRYVREDRLKGLFSFYIIKIRIESGAMCILNMRRFFTASTLRVFEQRLKYTV